MDDTSVPFTAALAEVVSANTEIDAALVSLGSSSMIDYNLINGLSCSDGDKEVLHSICNKKSLHFTVCFFLPLKEKLKAGVYLFRVE